MNNKRVNLIVAIVIVSSNMVLSAQNHILVQITFSDSTHDGYPSWSPDGKKIAFSSTRTGYWAIWVMEPNLKDLKEKLKIKD